MFGDKKGFDLYDLVEEKDGELKAVLKSRFQSRIPFLAARKAANRGHTLILLRKRGEMRVSVYTGSREKKVHRADAPPRMAGKEYWSPKIKRVGVLRFKGNVKSGLDDLITELPSRVEGLLG